MRKFLLKGLAVVAAMLTCLSASAIDKVVKVAELTGEITSLEDLYAKKFILQNEEGKLLYIPSGWDMKVSVMENAVAKGDQGVLYQLVDAAGHKQMEIYNVDGSRRKFWAGDAYVNAQPSGGNVIFGLGGTSPNYGQDGPNLALWDVTYEAGKGFAFHNAGRDIYLGSDADNARPSNEVVYWKAYTGYNAGYVKEDVEVAYKEAYANAFNQDSKKALDAAKAAYDAEGNLDKFAEAVNAAINLVNDAQASYEIYSKAKVDSWTQSDVLAVIVNYKNGKYANAAEFRKALAESIKGQDVDGADMTLAIINPSFETGTLEGWESKDCGAIAGNMNFGTNIDGQHFVEKWTGNNNKLTDGTLLQTLTGMPNGKYTLTANMQNLEEGNNKANGSGFYLVINDDKTDCTAPGQVSVTSEVTDGTLTIGVKLEGCTGNWMCIDNFQLTLVESAKPELATIPEEISIVIPKAATVSEGKVEANFVGEFEVSEEILLDAVVTLSYTLLEDGAELDAASDPTYHVELDPVAFEQNFFIEDVEPGKSYTLTVNSISIDYESEDGIQTAAYKEFDDFVVKFETAAVPTSINGIDAAKATNGKYIENSKVVLVKNGKKVNVAGISIK